MIDSMQVYYGKAIRDNIHSIEMPQESTDGNIIHSESMHKDPQKSFYPEGKDSWCGFQRDFANGTNEYSNNHPLQAAAADAIEPVFIALRS